MSTRIRDLLFYASSAFVFTAVYSALVPIGYGRKLQRSAGDRVARARRHVERAGRSLVRRIRSAA